MKQFACLVCLLFCSVLARALDREAFTFTHYALDARIEPEQQRLGVRGKITLRNDSGSPQRSLSLQISSSLNWSSITVAGKPVEFLTQSYISDIDHTGALSEAIVVLPQPVAPKQSVELEIGYEGVLPQDVTRLTRIGVPDDQAKHSDWDQIGRTFTAIRGIGYVAWYPIATEAASLSDGDSVVNAVERWKQRETDSEMKVALTISATNADTKLLCNGTGAQVAYEQSGTLYTGTAQCAFSNPGMNVPAFVIGNFGVLEQPAADIFYGPDRKPGASDYASALDEIAPLISKWFGDHREKAGMKPEVIDLPDAQAASYESGNMLLMPLAGSDTKLLLAAAHQLAQVYFPSPRTWVSDGLATYAQVRLIEEKEGRQAAIQYLQAHEATLLESQKQIFGSKNGATPNSFIDGNDEFRVQTKAMYVWWMLHDMVGDNAFSAALIAYKASEDQDPAYMQKLIEMQSHRDLQWFFDDWVYHDRGLPDFRIVSVFPNALPSGGYMVTVTVENVGGAGAEIPVTLHMQSGETSERLTVPGKSKATIRIEAPSMPQTVTVNDGSVPESDVSNNQYTIQSLSH